MPAGLPAALVMLAEAAAYGPAAPAPPKAAAKPIAEDSCKTPPPDASTREIVICAQRSNGYRLNPDLMEAREEKRQQIAIRPKTPGEKAVIDDCSIGPNTCVPTGPNLLAAAIGAITMATRLAQGKEVGSMFETRPQMDEYHLYLAAKERREARETAARAAAIVAQAKAKAAQASHTPNAASP